MATGVRISAAARGDHPCWLIYRLYFSQLLDGVGLRDWAQTIIVLEALITILVEPVAGSLSDQQKYWMGTRFPMIGLGSLLAALLFIAIPLVFSLNQPGPALRVLLAMVLLGWAGIMALFRSPAIALIGQYAIARALPQAMSVLIVVGGLVRAIQPITTGMILSWGPGITFALGSLSLLGAVIVIRWFHPNVAIPRVTIQPPDLTRTLNLKSLGLIIGLGVFVAWGTRIILGDILSFALATQVPGSKLELLSFAILALLAVAALPAGRFAVKVGNHRALVIGLVMSGAVTLAMAVSQGAFVVFLAILILVASYSLVANGTIPFALYAVPIHRSGLGVGLYFSGFGLGMAFYDYLMPHLSQLSLISRAGIGAIAFLLGGVCVRVSR
ncbi:MAG: MFS transporter [Oscillatoriales cyanobacterium RM1_1_9]|nr:MFS transporter [Oscillatoriales cyanobacterium RM1_1_9]